MRRIAWIILFGLITTAGSHAADRGVPDFEKELAWARATWPGDLKGLHFHSPLQKLRAWVPRDGSTTVYLYTEDFACRRAVLSRGRPDRDATDLGEEDAAPPRLVATIHSRPRNQAGERVRDVIYVDVDRLLSREEVTFGTESQDAQGSWHDFEGGGGDSEPTVYGALSHVDDRIARWEGRPMEIRPYCDGPVEWLACAAGGERPCERCEAVGVMVLEPNALAGHGRDHGRRPITCHDACPPYPESPDLTRLYELANRTQVWLPRKASPARVPSLYRAREDCLREHPG